MFHKFVVVTTVSDTVVDSAATYEEAVALKASWFRTFPDSSFSVRPVKVQA